MRKEPYTEIGIRRLKCYRCGKCARYQWQICADGNVYRPICVECDLELNRTVLEFMGIKDVEEKMERYRYLITQRESRRIKYNKRGVVDNGSMCSEDNEESV